MAAGGVQACGTSLGEWAWGVVGMIKGAPSDLSNKSYEPSETTAAVIQETIGTLTRYRTVNEALGSLKSDAKRRSKKPVSA